MLHAQEWRITSLDTDTLLEMLAIDTVAANTDVFSQLKAIDALLMETYIYEAVELLSGALVVRFLKGLC